MQEQTPNLSEKQLPPPSFWHQHRSIYFILAIVGLVAIASGVLIAIKNFSTEQEVNSVQIPAECTSHGSALLCSRVRAGMSKTTPVSTYQFTK